MDMMKSFSLLTSLKTLKQLMDAVDEEEYHQQRRCCVKPFFEKRQVYCLEAHILKDILWDTTDYNNFCRLNVNDFENLLSIVNWKIKKKDTVMRDAIPARTRLATTLRYIATGDSYRSLEHLIRVSRKTISKFVPEVLNAIITSLSDKYLKMPLNKCEWRNVSDGFNKLWQFPHTLGALDGKHVRINRPPHAGPDCYNYKGHHSIVLLAVVDAHSRFLYIDVLANERASDVGLLPNSKLYEGIMSGKLNFPPDEPLPGQITNTPYGFIGADVFENDQYLLKAYNSNTNLTTAQRIFNYRLNRARMTVEMAFGRLTSRFRIFHRPIDLKIETCDLVATACCILHNMLTKVVDDDSKFNPDPTVPELPSTITTLPTQQYTTERFANEMRENIKKYLITDGDVPYQWPKIRKQVADPVSVSFE